jgi:putative hydrolase of the HAD superfamily
VKNEVIVLEPERSVVKAVTFDLWETLLFERDGSDLQRKAIRCRNLTQVLTQLGLSISVSEVEKALNETMSSLLQVWNKNEDVSHLDQVRLFVKYASRGKIVPKDEWLNELSTAYVLPLFMLPPYLSPDVRETLEWLTGARKRVGIICNTGLTPGTELRRLLSQLGVAKYFHAMIFSNEVCIRKPDKRIFCLAAQALKTRPEEVVHVGDNLKADAWGAKNAGFKAIHLSSDAGRDKIAESDPTSLVSLSRSLGNLNLKEIEPDRTITSFSMVKKAIIELEKIG